MTKQDETELKEIISKFATIDGFLDCLKEIEAYVAKNYVEDYDFKHFRFNGDTYFTFKHIANNYYKIAFSYKDHLYNISFLESVWGQPSQEFARALVREGKEIFERLDAELREEREQEFASKISKSNNKTKYASKVPELLNEEIQKANDANEVYDKVYKLLDKYAELTGDYSKSSYAIKKRLEDESNLNDGGNKEEDEEFIEIHNNYVKPSAVVAICEDDFEYPCVKIILKGGQEIKTKHAFDANIFNFLEKNKESFSRISDIYMKAYIRPEYAVAISADTNCEYNAICVALKYGGKVIFPASRYTADEILEQLEKGKNEFIPD